MVPSGSLRRSTRWTPWGLVLPPTFPGSESLSFRSHFILLPPLKCILLSLLSLLKAIKWKPTRSLAVSLLRMLWNLFVWFNSGWIMMKFEVNFSLLDRLIMFSCIFQSNCCKFRQLQIEFKIPLKVPNYRRLMKGLLLFLYLKHSAGLLEFSYICFWFNCLVLLDRLRPSDSEWRVAGRSFGGELESSICCTRRIQRGNYGFPKWYVLFDSFCICDYVSVCCISKLGPLNLFGRSII